MYNILSLGGVFSGSFVLKCVLGEEWEENDPNDIDIYVNHYMLEGMLKHNMKKGFDKYHELSKSVQSIEATILATPGKTIADVSIKLSQIIPRLEELEVGYQNDTRIYIGECVRSYIGANTVKIVKATDAGIPLKDINLPIRYYMLSD